MKNKNHYVEFIDMIPKKFISYHHSLTWINGEWFDPVGLEEKYILPTPQKTIIQDGVEIEDVKNNCTQCGNKPCKIKEFWRKLNDGTL